VVAVLVVAGAMNVLVGACGGGGGVPDTNPIAATDDSIAMGARLYQSNCQVCHGPEGKGSERAADLRLHVPIRTDGFLFTRITEGFPPDSDEKLMPAFGSALTETERWHLVNFLRATIKEPEPVIPEDLSP
jgi:mono/diheme cytochrome c family protein